MDNLFPLVFFITFCLSVGNFLLKSKINDLEKRIKELEDQWVKR